MSDTNYIYEYGANLNTFIYGNLWTDIPYMESPYMYIYGISSEKDHSALLSSQKLLM